MRVSEFPNMEEIRRAIDQYVDGLTEDLFKVNTDIHEHPEIAFSEYRAHDSICRFLEALKLPVTRHAFGIETSFEARSGREGRCVNFNAEYDALPGIGHACGHNLITTAALTGFTALSFALEHFNVKGRAQLLGTPAEEDGGGKIILLEKGAYNDVDVSLMIHPMSENDFLKQGVVGAAGQTSIANVDLTAEYRGVSAHAGGNPWDGINALDAVVSAYNNISMLRQQIRPDERIHGCILQAPKVTNAIPEFTKIKYSIRSPTIHGAKMLVQRVRHCIDAGASATGCGVEITEEPTYADLRVNESLCDLFHETMGRSGEELMRVREEKMTGSTDQGNVSYEMPALHAIIGIPTPEGAQPHDRSFAAAAGTREAFARVLKAGKAMALSGIAILVDDGIYSRIVEDFQADRKLR